MIWKAVGARYAFQSRSARESRAWEIIATYLECRDSERSGSDHVEVVTTCDVDVEKESNEVSIVGMSYAVVHPGTYSKALICYLSDRGEEESEEQCDEQWWSILSTQVLHWRQWCALGGLYTARTSEISFSSVRRMREPKRTTHLDKFYKISQFPSISSLLVGPSPSLSSPVPVRGHTNAHQSSSAMKRFARDCTNPWFWYSPRIRSHCEVIIRIQ